MRIVLGMLLALATAGALGADAGAAVAARAAMQAGNYAEAYCAWRALADQQNDAEAQYNLGWMYHNGYGLVIDDQQARTWWEKAAQSEYADALSALGSLYYSGSGPVAQDGPRAVDYFVRAARRGDDDSAALLRSLIARNDPALGGRRAELLVQNADALGNAVIVKANDTGFRKSAGTDSRMLSVFEAGKTLIELSRRSGWVQAGDPIDGRVGWIKATRVKPAPPPAQP